VISDKLQKPALRALESLISLARFHALKNRPSEDLAEFLDRVSYLPQLMLDEADRAEDFIKCLRQLSELTPESELVLREFESQLN
jgi:hypothetical protein